MNAPFKPKFELPDQIPETNPYLEHIKKVFQGGILGSEYLINWHHQLKTWYLHLWTMGIIRFLIIMEPPQYGKTEIGGVQLPGYIFKEDPDTVIGYMTYGQDRANTISEKAKTVMRSNEYMNEYNGLTVPSCETGVKKWNNSLDGRYYAMGRECGVDGEAIKYMIFDDLYKNQKEGLSPVTLDSAWDIYSAIGLTRIPPDGRVLLYFKRWHTRDIIGRCITDMEKSPFADQYEILFLPAEITSENIHLKHPLDPRKEGEPLWPFKHSIIDLRAREISLKKALYDAEFQQVPLNAKGININTDWFTKKISRSEIPQGLKWFRYYRLAELEKGTIDKQNATCKMAKSKTNEFYISDLRVFDGSWAEANEHLEHTAKAEKGVKIGIKNAGGDKAQLVETILEKKKKSTIKSYDSADPLNWAADAKAGKIHLVDDEDTKRFLEACQLYTGSGKDGDECLIQALAGAWNMIKSKRTITQAMAATNKNKPISRRHNRWLNKRNLLR
jgi:hypothetical protein